MLISLSEREEGKLGVQGVVVVVLVSRVRRREGEVLVGEVRESSSVMGEGRLRVWWKGLWWESRGGGNVVGWVEVEVVRKWP